MFFGKKKYLISMLLLISFFLLLFFIKKNAFSRPLVKLESVDLINKNIKFKITNVKVGDVVLLLKNSDDNCNLGSVESISAVNKSTQILNARTRDNEYLYLFRIKVISGKKTSCSSELVINLFN